MNKQTWFNAERVAQPGSVILNKWMAERRASKVSNSASMANGTLSMSELSDWLFNQRNGEDIATPRDAMRVSAVYACCALIGGAVASIPLHFYRRGEGLARERITTDEWWMFNEQPHPAWAAAVAWEYALNSLLLEGDSFWRIHRASRLSPKITAFEPWHPRLVDVNKSREADRLLYRFYKDDGKYVDLDQDDVLHVPGPGFDGKRGASQISVALGTAAGIARSADLHTRSFFKNGARPDFVLQTNGALSQADIDTLRAQWAELYQGPSKAFKPAVLGGGLKVEPITINSNDAQLIEARRFQVEDICRIFGVPPFMVGHTEKTTSWGSGVEQMSIGFVKYTLQRHLVKFEQEINRKVFRQATRFSEFNTAGLERGDLKTRSESYRIALGRAGEQAWMTVDEVRALENLPPKGMNTLAEPTPTQGATNEPNPPAAY